MDRIEQALKVRQLAMELGDYDAHVNGMVGEVIAEDHYGMTKAARGVRKIDGTLPDRRTVQVKVLGTDLRDQVMVHTSGVDALLVIKMESGSWREVYFGSVEAAAKASTYNERDGRKTVTLYHLGQCSGADANYVAELMRRYNAANRTMSGYSADQIAEVETFAD